MSLWNHTPSAVTGRRSIVGLGGIYLVVAAVWGLYMQAVTNTSLVGILVVCSFIGGSGVVLLGGGYRLSRTDIDAKFHTTIANWCLVGIAVMLLILLLYHAQPDTGLTEPERSIPVLTGFSAVAGFSVGTYAARAKTHAHRVERQNELLERTQAQLEASNERLEQFAYAASHDLQEPLRMVSSYLQLVDSRYGDELDEEGQEFVEYAIDGSERMKAMIDGLLEYSRVDTQGDPFESVDLETVVDDVCKDLEVRIDETDATIDVDPLPRVEGDPSQLRQLFQNLVSNAIEYSGDEPPRIEITADRDGKQWVVAVSDEGIGIDPDQHDRVFDLFQRLHTHDERTGTGIGLALCERIVERHDGDIWIDSEPDVGTTVSVKVPAATDAPRGHTDRQTPVPNA